MGLKTLILAFVCLGFFYLPQSIGAAGLSEVLINEIAWMGTAESANSEWLELKNNTEAEIDLSGWVLAAADGTPKINLSGLIPAQGYFLLERTSDETLPSISADQIYSGALSNGGEVLELKDASGNLIDKVDAATSWPAGNNDTKQTMERTDSDWQTSQAAGGTPKAANSGGNAPTEEILPSPGSSPLVGSQSNISEVKKDQSTNFNLIITELMPDPAGVDEEGEFIEIFNAGQGEANLSGWLITNDKGQEYKFVDQKLAAKNYLMFGRRESGLILDNSTETIKLYKPGTNKARQTIKYKEASTGQSYAMDEDGEWNWTKQSTPGDKNKINHPPRLEVNFIKPILAGRPVTFDTSDSYDRDGEELIFNWDFGDGFTSNLPNPEHTYLKPGNFKLKVAVSDGIDEIIKEETIKVDGGSDLADSNLSIIKSADAATRGQVIINEILPNPVGSDQEGEWIELFNAGESSVNLLNWRLDDEAGGSAPYTFKQDEILAGEDFYLLKRPDSGLALNNEGDEVRLFDGLGDLVDQLEYGKAGEGRAYARKANGAWVWTTVLTPGGKNEIIGNQEISNVKSDKNTAVKTVNPKMTAVAKVATLKEIKEMKAGALVRAAGVVAVEPGILGSQIFYIVDEADLPAQAGGIQVYSYKKDFPKLKLGDEVEVSGELSEAVEEKRIKTKSAADIKIIGESAEPAATLLAADEISENHLGRLVKVSGELIDKNGSSFYLDDGRGEIEVYFKSTVAINKENFKIGDQLAVAGILTAAKNGFRLLPRRASDLNNSGQVEVLGESSDNNEWAIAGRDKKAELMNYLLVLAAGVIIVLAGFLIKFIRRKV